MAELFTDEWINALKDAWNNTPEVTDKLAEIDFDSKIACGFKDDDKSSCIFVVEKGVAVSAGLYNGEDADWDMRADQKHWDAWAEKPLTMMTMGLAVTTGKLKFEKGDFKSMIKNPSMAGPFIKSFALMGTI